MSQSTRSEDTKYRGIEDLTDSEYHELFASSRRRAVLDVLASSSAPIGIEELALTIAVRERDAERADEEAIKCVTLYLHHVHLPKMAEFGVLEYDRTPSATVRFE